MATPIIEEETLTLIKRRDDSWIGPPQNGTRKISLGLLSPLASASSRLTSSSSSLSPDPTSPETAKYITIPTDLDSPATFQFLGFTVERASELYHERESKKSHMSIVQCAQGWIEEKCAVAQDGTDEWDSKMVDAGIREDIRLCFQRPEHAEVRLLQSLGAWLSEIVETLYDALIDMNARILQELATHPEPQGFVVVMMMKMHTQFRNPQVEILRSLSLLSSGDGTAAFLKMARLISGD
jgi:hypothetical protein